MNTDALLAVLRAAGQGRPLPQHTIRLASRQLNKLVEGFDSEKESSLALSRRILHAKESGVSRQGIMERFGISKTTMDRRLALARSLGPDISETNHRTREPQE
jgi:hypothetical protein